MTILLRLALSQVEKRNINAFDFSKYLLFNNRGRLLASTPVGLSYPFHLCLHCRFYCSVFCREWIINQSINDCRVTIHIADVAIVRRTNRLSLQSR